MISRSVCVSFAGSEPGVGLAVQSLFKYRSYLLSWYQSPLVERSMPLSPPPRLGVMAVAKNDMTMMTHRLGGATLKAQMNMRWAM